MDVTRQHKLFRAIVIMGASITAPACFDPLPPPCVAETCIPLDAPIDEAVAFEDAGSDGPEPNDGAPQDVVLII